MYVNGVLAAEATVTSAALRQHNLTNRIGYFQYAAGRYYFQGDISDFVLDNTPWPVAKMKNKVALDTGFF